MLRGARAARRRTSCVPADDADGTKLAMCGARAATVLPAAAAAATACSGLAPWASRGAHLLHSTMPPWQWASQAAAAAAGAAGRRRNSVRAWSVLHQPLCDIEKTGNARSGWPNAPCATVANGRECRVTAGLRNRRGELAADRELPALNDGCASDAGEMQAHLPAPRPPATGRSGGANRCSPQGIMVTHYQQLKLEKVGPLVA